MVHHHSRNLFTDSADFTSSSSFSISKDLTESISFKLTPSDRFSKSVSFSDSNSLIQEPTTEIKTSISPNENAEVSKESVPIGLIIGIIVACFGSYSCRRKRDKTDGDEEVIEFTTTIPDSAYDPTQEDNLLMVQVHLCLMIHSIKPSKKCTFKSNG